MATEDKTVKVTEEYAPDGSLTKKTKEYPPKKTISDWIAWCAQVLAAGAVIVSIVALAVGVYQFKAQQSESAQMQATQLAASAAQTLDQERQATLDGYLDAMSNLLLVYHLGTPNSTSEVTALAQAQTYAAVRNLDGPRKGTLVRFLWEAGLISESSKSQPIISMLHADLSGAIFTNADLRGADLGGADLSGAIFTSADLRGAGLSNSVLRGADLEGADLSALPATFPGGQIPTCSGCSPPNPKHVPADLSGADLSDADLLGAQVTTEQLAVAESLKGATMPDGSKHP